MRKNWILLLIAIAMASVQCTHPFEEGMLGSFPFLEIEGNTNFNLDYKETAESHLHLQIPIKTNQNLSHIITYSEQEYQKDWINEVKFTPGQNKEDIILSMTVDMNTTREFRNAKISILTTDELNMREEKTISISQNPFDIQSEEKICEGDLILRNQKDVDNCIYVGVNGRLIIANTDPDNSMSILSKTNPELCLFIPDIQDLSPLQSIRFVKKGMIIRNAPVGLDLTQLEIPSVPYVEMMDFNEDQIRNMNVSTPSLTLNHVYVGDIRTCVENKTTLKELYIYDSEVSRLNGLDLLQNLERLYAQSCANILLNDGIQNCPSLKEVVLSDCKLYDLPLITSCPSLTKLKLDHNYLSDVSALVQLPQLKDLDLSYNPLNKYHLNYIKHELPNTIIEDFNDHQDDMSLTMNLLDVTYSSAKISFERGRGNFTKAGYILSDNGSLDIKNLVDLEEFSTGTSIVKPIYNLEPEKDYSVWLYGEWNKTPYLSDVLTFKTEKIVYLDFHLLPIIPEFANAKKQTAIQYFRGARFDSYEGGCSLQKFNTEKVDSTYTVQLHDGPFNHIFYGSEVENAPVSVNTEHSMTDFHLQRWIISQAGEEGMGGDFILGCGNMDLQENIIVKEHFVRPVSCINVNLELPDSLLKSHVMQVETSLDNCYDQIILTDYVVSFEGNTTNRFIRPCETTDGVIKALTDAYILPNTGVTSTMNLVIQLMDGSKFTVSTKLDKYFDANHHYEINVKIDKKQQEGSFVIEDIVIVEDVIEF